MKLTYENSIEVIKKFYSFCGSHSKIYIYGAGVYGRICLDILRKKDIQIEGFITTTGGEDVLGFPVYCAESILNSFPANGGIIFAVKEEYLKEIKRCFVFSCDTWTFELEQKMWLQLADYLDNVRSILIENNIPSSKELSVSCWKNILVVQLEVTFGDMIWSSAFYRELRYNFPNSRVVVVMNSKFVSLYKNCPYINQIIPYQCDELVQYISFEIMEKAKRFTQENYGNTKFDAVFMPRLFPVSENDSWENILLAFASGAPNRIAHAMYIGHNEKYICDRLSDLFTIFVKHEIAKHEVMQDLDLLTACGCQYKNDKMELWIDDTDREFALSALTDISDNVLLIAVAMVGSTKRKSWDPLKYGNVFCKAQKRYGSRVIFLLCGGGDAVEAVSMVPDWQKANCIDMTNQTTLTEVGAIIGRCDIYMGSDTGLMHMAAALNLPVIEIAPCNRNTPDFLGTSPTRVGPWKTDSIILMSEKGLDECRDTCIKPYAHCINQITEEQVLAALDRMIGKLMESPG